MNWSDLLAGVRAPALFGDGSDGTVTVSSGTTTLTRNMFYNNLTISGTGSIDANGYKICVKDTLDISNAPAGAIKRLAVAGGNASGTTQGAIGTAPTTAEVGGGGTAAAGRAGATNASANGTSGTTRTDDVMYLGGLCGASGAGGNSNNGGFTGGSGSTKPSDVQAIVNQAPHDTYMQAGLNVLALGGIGGQGGGSGACGASGTSGGSGAGGCGGGVLDIRANRIKRGASTTALAIQAVGGAGGNGANASGTSAGGGGGGSGGGGGHVQIIYRTLLGASSPNAIAADGGAGGNGGTTTGGGAAAGGGNGGDGGRVRVVDAGAGVVTETIGQTPTTPPIGTTGGSGGLCRVTL